jgi:hypothetical protein
MQWLNVQSNLMDSLRYLIENEIKSNGVRNLQAYIPVERNTLKTLVEIWESPEPPLEEEIDDDDIKAWI